MHACVCAKDHKALPHMFSLCGPQGPTTHVQSLRWPAVQPLQVSPLKAAAQANHTLYSLHNPLTLLHNPLTLLHNHLTQLHNHLTLFHAPLTLLHAPLTLFLNSLTPFHAPLTLFHAPLTPVIQPTHQRLTSCPLMTHAPTAVGWFRKIYLPSSLLLTLFAFRCLTQLLTNPARSSPLAPAPSPAPVPAPAPAPPGCCSPMALWVSASTLLTASDRAVWLHRAAKKNRHAVYSCGNKHRHVLMWQQTQACHVLMWQQTQACHVLMWQQTQAAMYSCGNKHRHALYSCGNKHRLPCTHVATNGWMAGRLVRMYSLLDTAGATALKQVLQPDSPRSW